MRAAEAWSVSPATPACFRAGQRVRVRDANPPGHLRTPWYVRGHIGEVERFCGSFPNPEELAYNRAGLPAQPLYRVRFRQNDVWPDYAGGSEDTIDVEIYQHWLEPA
jgi:nitrile hydratase